MKEPDPAGVSPGTTTAADAPTPQQTALLQYLDVTPAEPITQAEAGILISQLAAAPDWQPYLQAWHRDKVQLHPDLFAVPPPVAKPLRSFREARWWQSQITDGSLYGYSFRQPSVNQALVILESLDAQAPGWDRESKKRRAHRFMNELATLSPELCKPGCSFPHDLPAEGDDSEDPPAFEPKVPAPSAPFVPNPYATTSQAPAAPSQPAWQPPVQLPLQATASKAAPARKRRAGRWALLLLLLAAGAGAYGYFGFHGSAPVRDDPRAPMGNASSQPATVLPIPRALESQRRAMEKYPDLATAGSPLNTTFVAMVHQLELEHSPRLQQPDWPEQVATQCATALLIKPATRHGAVVSPTPAARPQASATPMKF